MRTRRFWRTRSGIRAVIVAAALFFTYAFFYQAGGWNQNSRFDVVRAVVEERSFRIDDYHTNTGDKALVDGHYYSDKAPGLALIAIPPVALARPVLDAVGIDSAGPKALTLLTYLATLLGVALPTALAAFGIYWLAQRLGASSAGATFAAVAFGIGTPIWAYATLFWGHALTAALLVGGLAARPRQPAPRRPTRCPRRPGRGLGRRLRVHGGDPGCAHRGAGGEARLGPHRSAPRSRRFCHGRWRARVRRRPDRSQRVGVRVAVRVRLHAHRELPADEAGFLRRDGAGPERPG